MKADSTDRCDFCGGKAVAFQHGASVCGQCGIRRTLGENPVILPQRRPRHVALVGALSSGMLVKVMMGSVALAAVGSVAAASLFPTEQNVPPQPAVVESSTTTAVHTSPAALTDDEIDDLVTEALSQAGRAHEHAAAVQEWAECVSSHAAEHRGESTNPQEACGDKPRPSDFGLANENSNRPEVPPGEERRLENSGDDQRLTAQEAEAAEVGEDTNKDRDKPEQAESPDKDKDKETEGDE